MAQDPSTINPFSSRKYTTPVWGNVTARDKDQRIQNFIGPYVYDLLSEDNFGEEDVFSLPDGIYELRTTNTGFFCVFDSNNQWTGYTLEFFLTDNDGEAIVSKKPIQITFLKGSVTPKLSKKQKGKFRYIFTLIDNTYPKYGSPPRPSNVTVNATVVDSNTGEPIKGVKTN